MNHPSNIRQPDQQTALDPKTALVELLDAYPAPWRASVTIAGPPGQAEVSIFDLMGELVDTGDDIGFAEGLVEAVNLAADHPDRDRPKGLILAELPDDLADALEGMKLAILRHRFSDYAEIDLAALLQSLDMLRGLARRGPLPSLHPEKTSGIDH